MSLQIQKNDKKAYWLIGIFSVIVFAAVVFLSRFTIDIDLGFDKHVFAKINAVLNSMVSILLVLALMAIKQKNIAKHRSYMLSAMVLSALFLVSYIAHHLFTGDTKFGGEGMIRMIYFIILITHIFLAAIILPFILFTAYRGLLSEVAQHKKLAQVTFPLWLYVSITGVVVYFMISPYYI
jgi:putative membrane protein